MFQASDTGLRTEILFYFIHNTAPDASWGAGEGPEWGQAELRRPSPPQMPTAALSGHCCHGERLSGPPMPGLQVSDH